MTSRPSLAARPSRVWWGLGALGVLLCLQLCQGNRLADNYESLQLEVDALREQVTSLRQAPPSSISADGANGAAGDESITIWPESAATRADFLNGAHPGSMYPVGHTAYASPPGTRGGVLHAAIKSDVDSFNPIVSKSLVSFGVLFLVFDPLFQLDPETREMLPRLATGYEASPDILEWTVFLRPDVRWADGHPFTADDVVFSFEVIRRPDVVSYSSREFDYEVAGERVPVTVEKIDDLTVRFTQPLPYPAFREKLCNRAIVPAHLLQSIAEDGGFQRVWGVGTDDFDQHVGTGPFRIESHQKGSKISLVANRQHWGRNSAGDPLPYLDGIVLQVVETPDVEFFRLKSGEQDLMGDVPGDLVPLLVELGHLNVFDIGTEVGWSYLAFNQNTGTTTDGAPLVMPHKLAWFRDGRFRRACSHALNRETIAENVYQGFARPTYSPFPASCGPFHHPGAPTYPHDVERASVLLTEMGLVDRDGDGVREDQQGNPVEFTITFYARSPELVAVVGMIADQLQAIGLKVHRNLVDRNRLLSALFEQHNFEALVSEDSGGVNWPAGDHPLWSTTAEYHIWFPLQQQPSSRWESQIDEIFRSASLEPDPSRVMHGLFRFQEIVGTEQPMIFVCSKVRSMAARGELRNFRPGPMEPGVLWNAAEMFLKKDR